MTDRPIPFSGVQGIHPMTPLDHLRDLLVDAAAVCMVLADANPSETVGSLKVTLANGHRTYAAVAALDVAPALANRGAPALAVLAEVARIVGRGAQPDADDDAPLCTRCGEAGGIEYGYDATRHGMCWPCGAAALDEIMAALDGLVAK